MARRASVRSQVDVRTTDMRGLPSEGPVAVKVCGLTDPDEARACAALGVWGIGLVFAAESPRLVDVAQAVRIAAAVPVAVARVGVFVDPSAEEAARIARRVGLTHIQFHGAGDPDALREATGGLPVIEGVRMDGAEAVERARSSRADFVLLDAAVPGAHGGTGVAFDWTLLDSTAPLGRAFGLAGGLRPANVGEAVAKVRPHLLDVSSGVEARPGRKDVDRVEAFLLAAAAPARVVA